MINAALRRVTVSWQRLLLPVCQWVSTSFAFSRPPMLFTMVLLLSFHPVGSTLSILVLFQLTNKLYFGEVVQSWPDTLRNLLADADALNPKCASEFNECMAALGAVLWYFLMLFFVLLLISLMCIAWRKCKRNRQTYLPSPKFRPQVLCDRHYQLPTLFPYILCKQLS